MKKGLLFLLLIAVIAFVSCTKKKSTEPSDPNEAIVSSAVVILTPSEANTITSVTETQVVFTGTLVTAAKLPAGKIIVSRPATAIPNGLLRKVLSTTASGNIVTVETTTATLEEVFTQADFSTEQPLRVSGLKSSRPLTDGVAFMSTDRDPERFSYSITKSVALGGGINLIAYGSLSLQHSFEFYLHKHKTDGITDINFNYNSLQTNTMSFSVNGAFDYSTDIDMMEQTFNPIVLTVGTVPVVVSPKVIVKLHIDADGEGNVTCTLNSRVDYNTGMDYQKPNWTTTNEKDVTYTHNTSSISQPVNIEVAAGAKLGLLFYGEASPYTEGMSYLNLTASNTLVPWWTMNGRFKANTGLNMAALGAGNSYEMLGLIDETTLVGQATSETCADPVFTPEAGTYDGNQNITITTATSGAQIRYTLDGSDPLQSSELYTAPILLTESKTIKAKVFKLHVNPSPIITAAYTIHPLPNVETPTFNPLPGTYPVAQSVTLSCATPGADIRYTTNGTEPNISSTLYTAPISVTTEVTIKARGFLSGYNTSPLATGHFLISTVQTVADPNITPGGGTYTGAQNVAMFCQTTDSQIKYTLDGTEPTETSNTYVSPIVIASPTTLKAKGFKSGWNPSQTVTEVYNYTIYEVGSIDTPGAAKAVAVTGNYALIADADNGLRIIDISDPTNPVATGSLLSGTNLAQDVVINGGNAYVGFGNHGLSIVDFSNPSSPTEIGNYTPVDEVVGVAVSGNIAYLANLNQGVRFVDISDPGNITPLGLANPNGTEVKVAVVGTRVYTANSLVGMHIIDASVPSVPIELGYYIAPGTTYDVAVAGNYVYLATSQGLRIVNATVPNALVPVGFLPLTSEVTGIKIRNNYAYLANGDSGLKIVDISNPANPVVAYTYNTPGFAADVFVNGDYAYVADAESGLRIIYVGNRYSKRK